MFERISNGWQLMKQSWRVLMQDKELMIFPLLSGFSCMLVLASFIFPLFGLGYADILFEDNQLNQDELQNPLVYVILFAFYFVNYFVIVFFNSALISCAIIRLTGGNPTIGDGFSAAMKRIPQIAAWALLSASVGVILKVMESRFQRVGAIISAALGTVWTIGTYFVVPILVVEKAGPIEACKRSVAVLKKNWGEAMVSNFGIGMLTFLALIPAFTIVFFGFFLLFSEQMVLGITALVVGVIIILTISLISATLDSIIIASLYLFAAEEIVPEQMDRSLLENAFSGKA